MVGYGGVQADMVLVKELRVLHLDPQGETVPHRVWLEHASKPASTVTHFPKEATPFNNSVTPYEPSIPTHECLG